MPSRISAIVFSFMLTVGAARAESISSSRYEAPDLLQVLVTRGASNAGTFSEEQLIGYSITFGLALDKAWPGRIPAAFSNRAMDVLRTLILGGGNVNNAIIAGSRDGETFIRLNAPDSKAAQSVIAVLSALVAG